MTLAHIMARLLYQMSNLFNSQSLIETRNRQMILEISVAIIAVFTVIFVVELLIVIFQVRRVAKEAEKLIDTARQQIAPLAHNLNLIVHDAQKIVNSVQTQVGKVEKGVEDIQQLATRFTDFEKQVERKIQQPVLGLVGTASAFLKAFQTFWGFWKKKKR